jgi:hypothetical protein
LLSALGRPVRQAALRRRRTVRSKGPILSSRARVGFPQLQRPDSGALARAAGGRVQGCERLGACLNV